MIIPRGLQFELRPSRRHRIPLSAYAVEKQANLSSAEQRLSLAHRMSAATRQCNSTLRTPARDSRILCEHRRLWRRRSTDTHSLVHQVSRVTQRHNSASRPLYAPWREGGWISSASPKPALSLVCRALTLTGRYDDASRRLHVPQRESERMSFVSPNHALSPVHRPLTDTQQHNSSLGAPAMLSSLTGRESSLLGAWSVDSYTAIQ